MNNQLKLALFVIGVPLLTGLAAFVYLQATTVVATAETQRFNCLFGLVTSIMVLLAMAVLFRRRRRPSS